MAKSLDRLLITECVFRSAKREQVAKLRIANCEPRTGGWIANCEGRFAGPKRELKPERHLSYGYPTVIGFCFTTACKPP
jgi:hypothetical protein